jgi:signal transduction histidine kinase
MKIRNKLTLVFGTTASLILILFGIAIYYFSAQYRKIEFNYRLSQRVDITEKMFLEKENLSEQTHALIREQFLNKLPEETEEVMTPADARRDNKYPRDFIESLLANDIAFFDRDSIQGGGKVFHLNGGDYVVILTARDTIGIQMLGHLRTILVLSLLGGIMVVSVVSWYVAGHVLNPIVGTIRKANAISAKNLHERLTVSDPENEIGQLSIAFNNLLDRVSRTFEAQRSFIDSASHEIRNPLTAILGEAELALEKKRTEQEYIDSLSAISTEADRLKKLVDNLLHLASTGERSMKFKAEDINVKDLVVETKKKFDFLHPENYIKLDFDHNGSAQPSQVIKGNGQLLQTALLNFFDNARKFSHNKPVVVSIVDASDHVSILVRDMGIGIPPEDIPKVTQPFHRASNVRRIEGAGIGIPLALKIIEMHKGSLEIQSELDAGTLVTVSLPTVRAHGR